MAGQNILKMKSTEFRKRKAGHGEIGAWLFYNLTVDLLKETLREMTAYAIAAHTHYTEPLAVAQPEGYERLPYWYGLEYLDDGKRPYGLAPILTRFCDRLDLSGCTHYTRHLLAAADSAEEGGEDFTGKDFYEFNEEKLVTIFTPEIREGNPRPQTVLEHVQMFTNLTSATPSTAGMTTCFR